MIDGIKQALQDQRTSLYDKSYQAEWSMVAMTSENSDKNTLESN